MYGAPEATTRGLSDSLLGAERIVHLLPVETAFDLGMRPTLHADAPMFPAEPRSLMRTAVWRLILRPCIRFAFEDPHVDGAREVPVRSP